MSEFILQQMPALRAYADITLDNCLSIKEIRVLNCYGRFTLCMPKVVQKDGSFDTFAYSSDHQTLKVIEDAVIAEYKKSHRREQQEETTRLDAQLVTSLSAPHKRQSLWRPVMLRCGQPRRWRNTGM